MSRYAEHDDWRGECLEASARKSSTLYDRHEIKYRPYTKVFIGCQIDDPAIRDRIFKVSKLNGSVISLFENIKEQL